MNTRRWPSLLLVMLLAGSGSGLQAQSARGSRLQERPRAAGTLKFPGLAVHDVPSERVSHLPINTDLADLLAPDERLRERLKGLHDKSLPKDVQNLARKLLKNPELLESLRKTLPKEEIERLQEKIRKGEGVGNDPALKKLFEEGKKIIRPEDEELLKRWGEKLKEQGGKPSSEETPGKTPTDKGTLPPVQSGPTSEATEKAGASWGRLQEAPDWLKKKIEGFVKNSNWVDSFMDRNWRDTLRELAKRAGEDRSQASALADRARGFTRYLPKASDYLPRNFLPHTPEPRLPSLPRFGIFSPMSRAGNWPSLSAPGPGKVVLWVVVLGVLGVVFWRAGGWWQHVRATQTSAWKLGPWPVRPGGVTTRADLVRAFEHLALLNLGQEARTCHHLDLADRIGEQPALDPDRRRQAARTLASLYEQARYTPDEERLPPEMMASARRELSYLAGVGMV